MLLSSRDRAMLEATGVLTEDQYQELSLSMELLRFQELQVEFTQARILILGKLNRPSNSSKN